MEQKDKQIEEIKKFRKQYYDDHAKDYDNKINLKNGVNWRQYLSKIFNSEMLIFIESFPKLISIPTFTVISGNFLDINRKNGI